MAVEKCAAIISASLAWAAAALLVGTHACRSSASSARPGTALATAEIHGEAQGRVLAHKDNGATHFVVELQGVKPGRYDVMLSNVVACPWDKRTPPADETATIANSEDVRNEEVEVGTVNVRGDGKGVLDIVVPVADVDTNDPAVLKDNTVIIRDLNDAQGEHADLTTGLIACGRFGDAHGHGRASRYLPLVPVQPILPPS